MKTTIYKIIFLIVLFSQPAINSQAQTPEQQFQKGIMKEEGEGSLREAIELYKSVADNVKADRALRAKALYQMGGCYEKLGQQDARGVYEKLVANYTDQIEMVTNAKRKLNIMSADKSAIDNSGIVIRKIPDPEAQIFAISPDERFATYNDWDDPEIGVVELKTGKKWFITKNGNWNEANMHYPLYAIWSPDSKHIVYDWNIEELGKDKASNSFELHIVNRDGTNERTLIKNGNKNLFPCDWSMDGMSILCIEHDNSNLNRIVQISVNDGSQKLVADLGKRDIKGDANYTNDGNYVVFSSPADSNPDNYDIFIIPREGGIVNPLITNKEDDRMPIRISGSDLFVYFSYHSGTKDLWCMSIKNGRIQGDPRIVKSDFDKSCAMWRSSTNGTLYYSSVDLNPEMYKARLNLTTHEVQTTTVNIMRQKSRKIIRAIWSPSFKYVAGMIETPIIPVKVLAPLKFVIQNVQSGSEYEISPDLSTYLVFWWTEPQWTQDEKSILIKGENNEGVIGLYQIDVQSGKVSPYKVPLEHAAWEWRWLQFSPDGESQYFVTQDGFLSKQKITVRSVKTGEEKIIKESSSWVDRLLLSPDGKSLAVQRKDTLWIMPSDGKGEMIKIGSFERLKGNPVGWSSDCKAIYVAKNDSKKGLGIWSISLNNEPPKELFSPDKLNVFKDAEGLKVTQVGNELYLTMQNGARILQYWAIENIIQN
jgi:dipeptidyl aminopeptidase/acylaminoacyl peptidase